MVGSEGRSDGLETTAITLHPANAVEEAEQAAQATEAAGLPATAQGDQDEELAQR